MDRAVEWYVAITAVAVGLSHVLRPRDWAAAFRGLSRCGRPGAFVNGWISLTPGAAVVAGHPSWAWPGTVITAVGWLLVIKGAACWLVPDAALRSMARGGESPRRFIAAGVLAVAVGGWAAYCLWHRDHAA